MTFYALPNFGARVETNVSVRLCIWIPTRYEEHIFELFQHRDLKKCFLGVPLQPERWCYNPNSSVGDPMLRVTTVSKSYSGNPCNTTRNLTCSVTSPGIGMFFKIFQMRFVLEAVLNGDALNFCPCILIMLVVPDLSNRLMYGGGISHE